MKIRFLKKKFIVLLSTVQIKLTNCGTDQQKRFFVILINTTTKKTIRDKKNAYYLSSYLLVMH